MTRRFVSPLQKIAQAQQETSTNNMETIHAYAGPPWAARVQVTCEPDREKAMEITNRAEGILITTSSSAKGDTVLSLNLGSQVNVRNASNNYLNTLRVPSQI